jgi:hypothetical protein
MITGLPAPPGRPDSGLAPSAALDAIAPNETVKAIAIALAKKDLIFVMHKTLEQICPIGAQGHYLHFLWRAHT